MIEKNLKRKVKKEDFYKAYIKCFNGFLNLTTREFEVLVEICNYQAQNISLNYSPEQLSKIVFGPTSREIIRTKLNISPYNLNNIIKTLKSKGIILIIDNHYYLNQQIYVPLIDTEYAVNYKIEIV